jgi:CarboxypepD_reg-like domain
LPQEHSNYCMRKLTTTVAFSVSLLLLFSYQSSSPAVTEVVEGIVISATNNKPVSNAHVYIVHGEEEALTNSKGEFRIETFQKFPLLLTVDHRDYEKIKLTISASLRKVTVSIKPKVQ